MWGGGGPQPLAEASTIAGNIPDRALRKITSVMTISFHLT